MKRREHPAGCTNTIPVVETSGVYGVCKDVRKQQITALAGPANYRSESRPVQAIRLAYSPRQPAPSNTASRKGSLTLRLPARLTV